MFVSNSNGSESLTPRNEYEYLGSVRYNVGTTGWQHAEIALAPTPAKNNALSQAVIHWAEQKQLDDWAPEKINAVGSRAVGSEISHSTGEYSSTFQVPATPVESPVISEVKELDEASLRTYINALHDSMSAPVTTVTESGITNYENVSSDPFEGASNV